MAKMKKKMIALCSVAISSIYMAGYYVTDSTDQNLATQQHVTSIPVSKPSTQSNTAKTSIMEGNSNSVQQTKLYKDGTYVGVGANRIGSVEVTLTIKNDTIQQVEITNCDTSYSQSYIDGLPNQVLSRQNANVDVVSGATRSTEDFQVAVEQALQQTRI